MPYIVTLTCVITSPISARSKAYGRPKQKPNDEQAITSFTKLKVQFLVKLSSETENSFCQMGGYHGLSEVSLLEFAD